MKIKHLFWFVCIAFAACNNDMEVVPENAAKNIVENALATDSVKVNESEINNILKSVLNKPETRANNFTMETISDEEGNPLIYVVNYENNGGFVLISATKNYFPVLAYNETGNFVVTEHSSEGMLSWKNTAIKTIVKSASMPKGVQNAFRKQWHKYENKKELNPICVSRMSGDEILASQVVVQDSVMSWISKHYDIYALNEDTGNDDINEEIQYWAQNYIYPEYEEDIERLTMIVGKPIDLSQGTINNFLLTTWSQHNGFNSAFSPINGEFPPAGCGPIAAAQTMRHFQHPSNINWASMPLYYATTTTAAFIKQLADRAHAEPSLNETPTTLDNLNNAIKSYGYTTSKGNHVCSYVWDNLEVNKPVIMAGWTQEDSGHAWVVSGGKHHHSKYRYEIYTITYPERFTCVNHIDDSELISYHFYMNWGWGGYSNGFYYDFSLQLPGYENEGQIVDRKIIYNITPI